MRADKKKVKATMSSGLITGQLDGPVGYCQLNRPDARNAMSREMWELLPEVLSNLKDAGAKVVVIRGAGRNFCAGADLNDLKTIDSRKSAAFQWHPIRNALNFVDSFELPTVAMIQGACLGGGCLLSIACDLRYAEPQASFAIPVAKLGIVLDDASILRLVALVGVGPAKELLLTAATISGAEAERLGLINHIVQPDIESHVREVAHKIAENGAFSVRATRASVQNIILRSTGYGNEKSVIDSYVSDDFRKRIKNAI